MSHAETQSIMHCPTQAATETSRQDALQNFLDAQVDSLLSPDCEENTVVMAAVESMLDGAELHPRHIALDKSRVDRSVSFNEELECNAVYRALQSCIAGQFRGGSFMTPMADGKHLFETDSNDHGYLYVGMCSLHAAAQAVFAGMVVADDREPQWAEDGAVVLAGSKAYIEDWHNWLELVFSGGDVPSAAEIGDALAKLFDEDSAAAAKRVFRLQTLNDSHAVEKIATAIATTTVLVESADTGDLDSFAQPFQMDGHRKAMSGASTVYAVPHVVGILRPEMGSPGHRVVVMQQQQDSPKTVIRTAPWSLAPGPKTAEAVVVEPDNMLVVPDNESDWAPGDPYACMSAVLRFTQSGWLTGTRVAMETCPI
jgi:hypothetical protein